MTDRSLWFMFLADGLSETKSRLGESATFRTHMFHLWVGELSNLNQRDRSVIGHRSSVNRSTGQSVNCSSANNVTDEHLHDRLIVLISVGQLSICKLSTSRYQSISRQHDRPTFAQPFMDHHRSHSPIIGHTHLPSVTLIHHLDFFARFL